MKKKIDKSIVNFIDRGASVKASNEVAFRNVLVRIPSSMLSVLDDLLKRKPWLNRTQWIVEAIDEKINEEMM